MKVIKFRVSNIFIGIDVLVVEAVTRCPEHLMEYVHTREVVGELAFHNRSVPLIEIAPWLGVRGYFVGLERYIIILDLVTVLVGLLVGEIDDIVEVEGELTMPLPGEGPRTVDFLRNTQSDGDIVHIIEPEVFFKRRDIEAFRKAAAKPIQPVPSKE